MDIVVIFIVIILIIKLEIVTPCGVNPAIKVQTNTGTNNTLHSDNWFNYAKLSAS